MELLSAAREGASEEGLDLVGAHLLVVFLEPEVDKVALEAFQAPLVATFLAEGLVV